MPRGKNKDPFKDLDQEYKDGIASMSDDAIRQKVAETSLENEQLQQAKQNDMDLQEAKTRYGEANRGYKESEKGAKLRIRYALSLLEARGKA